MPEVSPLDVLVVGKDMPNAKKKTAQRENLSLPSEVIAALARDQEVANESLARLGVYAEGLAASNNWVVASVGLENKTGSRFALSCGRGRPRSQ